MNLRGRKLAHLGGKNLDPAGGGGGMRHLNPHILGLGVASPVVSRPAYGFLLGLQRPILGTQPGKLLVEPLLERPR